MVAERESKMSKNRKNKNSSVEISDNGVTITAGDPGKLCITSEINLEKAFKNESNNVFTDISSEEYREYHFSGGELIRIDQPLKLNVSPSGGHRLYDASGVSHYIPKGWKHLKWKAWPGLPNFVK